MNKFISVAKTLLMFVCCIFGVGLTLSGAGGAEPSPILSVAGAILLFTFVYANVHGFLD